MPSILICRVYIFGHRVRYVWPATNRIYIYTNHRSVLKCLLDFSIVVRNGWLGSGCVCCYLYSFYVSHCFWCLGNLIGNPKSCCVLSHHQTIPDSECTHTHAIHRRKEPTKLRVYGKKEETNRNETFSRFYFFPCLSLSLSFLINARPICFPSSSFALLLFGSSQILLTKIGNGKMVTTHKCTDAKCGVRRGRYVPLISHRVEWAYACVRLRLVFFSIQRSIRECELWVCSYFGKVQ